MTGFQRELEEVMAKGDLLEQLPAAQSSRNWILIVC